MVNNDPYLLPDANILDNCFGEKNNSSLQEYEIFFSGLRICELIDNPIPGLLDYDYLKRIHAYVFQDIYPGWSGRTRTIKMFKKEKLLKGKSVKYTHPGIAGSKIEELATQLFLKLHRDLYLQGIPRTIFCDNLAIFLFQLWKIHPFRDGNTRSIMVICYYISLQAGYPLSLRYIDNTHEELRQSLVLSTINNPQKLQQYLYKASTYRSRWERQYWINLFKFSDASNRGSP